MQRFFFVAEILLRIACLLIYREWVLMSFLIRNKARIVRAFIRARYGLMFAVCLLPSISSAQTTVVQDTFTDVAGTDLPVHTPDVHPVGSSWATPAGKNPLEVNASARCVATVNSTDNDALIDSKAANGTLIAIVNAGVGSNPITLWFRSNSDLTDALGIECNKGTSQLHLISYVSGVRTVLQTVALTWTDNTAFDVQIDFDASDIVVMVNDVIRGDWTSSENLTETYIGIELERLAVGQYVDDFTFTGEIDSESDSEFYNLLLQFAP